METTSAAQRPTTESPAPHSTPPKKTTVKDLLTVNIGNAIEWFDWNVYAIFAVFFAGQIFHSDNQLTSMLSTLAIFAVGFLMRPLGGWIFGHLADRKGRKYSLTLAIFLAALGSLMIAVVPTFDQVGAWAAVILLLARLIQGLSHGGETGSAFTYLAEISPKEKRGLWASTPWMGVAIGTMLATGTGVLLTNILSDEQMTSFGWRIPFVLGALLGLYGLLMRMRMAESNVFEEEPQEESKTLSLRELGRIISANRKAFLYIATLSTSGVVVFYTWFIFAPTYATTVYNVPANHALLAGLLGQAVYFFMIPLVGYLTDRFGRRPMILIGTLGFAIVAFPLEWIMGDSGVRVFLAMAAASIILAFACVPLGAIFTEAVESSKVRATVVGLTYGGFAAVFGGLAPYLNTWLTSLGHHWLFVVSAIILSLISFVICLRLPETKGKVMN